MGNYMNHEVIVPKFTIADVSGVTFGGFAVDKYICSQPNATPAEGSPDVAHNGAAGAVPGISKQGIPVWDYVSFPNAMIACCNKGKGWHLMSAFEWRLWHSWRRNTARSRTAGTPMLILRLTRLTPPKLPCSTSICMAKADHIIALYPEPAQTPGLTTTWPAGCLIFRGLSGSGYY